MDQNDLRELKKVLGEKRFNEMVERGRKLKAAGKSPDEIAKSLRRSFPGAGPKLALFALTPISQIRSE